MLVLDLSPGEGIEISGRAVIHMKSKAGQVAKLAIDASKDVRIKRIAVESATPRSARDGLTKPK
jgi:sRNA-binding carbon storage regulator CsrA